MIEEKSSLLYWNYFLALESDMQNVARFIEFTNSNFKTFSIELAHLLLASSSEVDVVAQELCKKLDPSKNASNINHYRAVITKHLPSFAESEIKIPRYSLTLHPWSDWIDEQNPDWWTSYNKVKHHRNEHFSEANLQNVINSLAGLLLCIFNYYQIEFNSSEAKPLKNTAICRKLIPESQLLRFPDSYYPGCLLIG